MARRVFATLTMAALAGCTGQVEGIDSSTGATGGASVTGGNGGTVVPPGPTQTECQMGALAPGRIPLRRLNAVEWNNTVTALLGNSQNLANTFPPDEVGPGGFTNNGDALRIDGLLVERNRDGAEVLSLAAVADLPRLLGCDPAGANETACVTQFIQSFGRRAFRRPLATTEMQRLLALYQAERTAGTVQDGVSLLVEAFLNSPHFLYLVPKVAGTPDAKGIAPLDPYYLASRLSYFLWQSMPDEPLMQAAAAGDLADPAKLEAQARRMLADQKAKNTVAHFHREWLELERIRGSSKVSAEWTSELQTALLAESNAFLREMFWTDGKLESLFQAPYTFLNTILARHYGLPNPPGNSQTMTKVNFPTGTPRQGFLTQALVLASHSYSNQTSPIHRGKFIREQFLCQVPPPPPPNLVVEPPPVDPNASTRERFRQHSDSPACSTCHALMDPIGLGFESYDTLGKFRTMDGNFPADPRGTIVEAGDADGDFTGAIELSNKLAGSKTVRDCVLTQWFRFSMARNESDTSDACARQRVADLFAAKGHDLRELPVALALSDAFRYAVGVTP